MTPELAAHVRALVEAAPPLTDARRERIEALLRPTSTQDDEGTAEQGTQRRAS